LKSRLSRREGVGGFRPLFLRRAQRLVVPSQGRSYARRCRFPTPPRLSPLPTQRKARLLPFQRITKLSNSHCTLWTDCGWAATKGAVSGAAERTFKGAGRVLQLLGEIRCILAAGAASGNCRYNFSVPDGGSQPCCEVLIWRRAALASASNLLGMVRSLWRSRAWQQGSGRGWQDAPRPAPTSAPAGGDGREYGGRGVAVIAYRPR